MYRTFIKRLLDAILSAAALILLSPVLAATALLVRAKLGSPVLFQQERPGLHGKLFRLYKFRTMNDRRDSSGSLLPDSERLTHFGRLLRSSSLDELPELWNILRGDMSIVGPRPLLPEYLPLYNREQRRRHDVRPGLTGLAQVNGRNALTWEEKFRYDVKYVDHVSLLLDIKILLQTVASVFRREGINAGETVTMEPFRGNFKDAGAETATEEEKPEL